ncbi:hypothetical protein Thivi_3733 [Thiocystis violascens DSM 198]|uniref:Uncharacterized protein n=1 Tax=Thiocystis violascens (strain ATCC 17096 / DSM 198 / 6111) TaxID=765911 RepID=I3YF11_THIV6|nr:hypothetical protein Thivi_3733 [Thiocystis violascens DSM 198]
MVRLTNKVRSFLFGARKRYAMRTLPG